jgi:hypothetical protein
MVLYVHTCVCVCVNVSRDHSSPLLFFWNSITQTVAKEEIAKTPITKKCKPKKLSGSCIASPFSIPFPSNIKLLSIHACMNIITITNPSQSQPFSNL